jgi:uncharacterized protein (DUF2164 family)
MSDISFSAEEKAHIVRRIQLYFDQELKQQIGRFDAEFLLDFMAEEVGVYFYNRGLYDAQAILSKRLDDLTETILDLEKPTEFSARS